MMRVHVHSFRIHMGLRTSFGSLAWVPASSVDGRIADLPWMWRCCACGEQGYEVAA